MCDCRAGKCCLPHVPVSLGACSCPKVDMEERLSRGVVSVPSLEMPMAMDGAPIPQQGVGTEWALRSPPTSGIL